MKKLIDDLIVTIKKDDTFYTYCSKWDNPSNKEVEFPNHRVGVGSTKQEALDKFMAHEKERQALLELIKERLKGRNE